MPIGGTAGSGSSPDASVSAAPPPKPRCGDGQIEADERCDIAIPAGAPGACPVRCTSPDPCLQATLTGTDCDSQCALSPVGCHSGDGCCPVQCNTASDADCSPTCGDAIVQASHGETCEIAENVDASQRCPTEADCKDKDACTLDALTGSAVNCNAACAHTPISAPISDDGCCPHGANANTDNDCAPICGNGVREGSEACDGTNGCDATCKLTLTPSQLTCLGDANRNSCAGCECTSCVDETLACAHSGNATRDAACKAVEACAVAKGCVGQACYCGSAAPDFTCALFANGACRSVIEMAAGTALLTAIDAQYRDANSALGRAAALGACRSRQCPAACHP
jgi:hypothetical protein